MADANLADGADRGQRFLVGRLAERGVTPVQVRVPAQAVVADPDLLVRQFDLLASLLDEDFVITFENGTLYGKTGYISFSATSTIKVDVAEMSEMKVRMHGNTAIVTGLYHERGKDKDGAYDYRDRFTDVWMNAGGRWRLIASHYGIPAKA